jgi:uridine kinase
VVIFVAGLSGFGKTVASSASRVTPILSLDAYFYSQHPGLPRWLGRTDWETIDSYDIDRAVSAVISLASGVSVDVPIYDHSRNVASGFSRLTSTGTLIAEGVYAPAVFERLSNEGIEAKLLLIRVSATTAFVTRLRRDIGQRHMNPVWAVIRSARLAFRHRRYIQTVLRLGAEDVDRESAPRRIAAIATNAE